MQPLRRRSCALRVKSLVLSAVVNCSLGQTRRFGSWFSGG